MNTKLVESLLQVILSLSDEERSLLEEKLFFDSSEPLTFLKMNQTYTHLTTENLSNVSPKR
ncbi:MULTISPECIES: hypothetical protein [Nostoc]|uniref:Uncharacterized protein n=1 Tax=Nostoc paludosum FACHB-159 TaxID=2692908 RepID=A0ABR8K530_9NOSO|nr:MULTISPECIES: hypothetical protein [Nostoc]MBD2733282.1 hypothetical protein [Nostoc paludosum FACHB-159]